MRAAELKKQEEAKRERNWKPQTRWKIIQATIAWAEEQATVRRNRPAAALKEQVRKLTGRRPGTSTRPG